ncbi:MAG TPA: hypothetical protein VHD91_08355 [Gaiellaceae bacterium]|nr:hypothetical protein [Gaiellaceae bacterium]
MRGSDRRTPALSAPRVLEAVTVALIMGASLAVIPVFAALAATQSVSLALTVSGCLFGAGVVALLGVALLKR